MRVLRYLAGLAFLTGVAFATPATAADKLGIVLLHGKGGTPGFWRGIEPALTAAGYLVESPELCWSRRRIYDRAYLDCLKDVDQASQRLRARGAQEIVVAGFSLGGNAALAYGARREGLKGVIAIAPAPPIEFLSHRPLIAKSLREARDMIAANRGDQPDDFADLNASGYFEVRTTPNIYVSFLAPDSPGVMPDNAAKLKVPLLIVSGVMDQTQRSIPYVFARTPARPENWHVTVSADHLGTLDAGRSVMLAWLKEIVR